MGKGIALGFPLSPLMGTLYLQPLGERIEKNGLLLRGPLRVLYGRVGGVAPTRWKLRAAIRAINQVMARLRVRLHPDKTIICRIARGFDFLGPSFFRRRADGILGRGGF